MCESNIPDDFEYDAILIDTSIYKQYALKLDKGLLRTLSQFKKGAVKLLMPDVIQCEIKKHLEEQIKQIIEESNRSIQDITEYSLVDQENCEKLKGLNSSINISKVVDEQFNSFVARTGAELINCGSLVNVTDLLESYFLSKPPFGNGKKKNEFPDAIVLYGIEEWAKQNDLYILALSIDKDWESYCKDSGRIEILNNLGQALKMFNTKHAPSFILRQIEDLVKREDKAFIEEINSFLDVSDEVNYPEAGSDLYYDLDGYEFDVESFNFTSEKLQVVQVDSDLLVVKANIDVLIKANASFSLSAYDSGDREYVNFSSCYKEIDVMHNTDILLTFEGEINTEQSIENLELTSVEALEALNHLDFGWLEPDFD